MPVTEISRPSSVGWIFWSLRPLGRPPTSRSKSVFLRTSPSSPGMPLPGTSSACTRRVWPSTRVTVDRTLREIGLPRTSTVPVTFTLLLPPYSTATPSLAASVRSLYEMTAVPVARAAVALE
ncbi:hypothetical protein EES42_07880 [Streptomyces sp. ADI95-17]|nr:hypothetical protein EES42_07880 [Streptomyces sp. ADI95-17]